MVEQGLSAAAGVGSILVSYFKHIVRASYGRAANLPERARAADCQAAQLLMLLDEDVRDRAGCVAAWLAALISPEAAYKEEPPPAAVLNYQVWRHSGHHDPNAVYFACRLDTGDAAAHAAVAAYIAAIRRDHPRLADHLQRLLDRGRALSDFLTVINSVKGRELVPGVAPAADDSYWSEHSCGHIDQAVLSVRGVRAARRFFLGYVAWFEGGGNSSDVAAHKARANIGSVWRRMSRRQRWLWWWAAGIGPSDTSYA